MKQYFYYIVLGLIILILIMSILIYNSQNNAIATNGNVLNDKKIEWGIKRAQNHEQPDLGSLNKKIIDENNGIAMGNKESKKVYLTFDNGYEAGYTEKILEVLKQNNVQATFFITAHYLNTQPDLVKRMIDEGHIIRQSYSKP